MEVEKVVLFGILKEVESLLLWLCSQELSKESIFESANRLLDRFMFILFAEDRGLIPANSIDTIIKQYENNHEWGDDTPLYNYYKKYFHFIFIIYPKNFGGIYLCCQKLQ